MQCAAPSQWMKIASLEESLYFAVIERKITQQPKSSAIVDEREEDVVD